MTECNRASLTFPGVGWHKITADFDAGRLTSDSGSLVLHEVDRRLELTLALADSNIDCAQPAQDHP